MRNKGNGELLALLYLSRGAESRRNILNKLIPRPKNCNELAIEAGLGWWTVQNHLKLLKKEELVRNIDFGRIKFYQLTHKGEKALTNTEINTNPL
ncbi:MAG: winged helix-turn-helix transcriptional regulator [Clostridiales bacterium]|nr:winged helix-turn-helix transcriptional regulator [Clostridiales bacterium]